MLHSMSRLLYLALLSSVALIACTTTERKPTAAETRERLIARALPLELNTSYVAPPGSALEHHAAGYAKVICSAVFVTGLEPDFAAENVGYFTAPYGKRVELGKPAIDMEKKTVSVTVPNGAMQTAVYTVGQGCVTLPADGKLHFIPKAVHPLRPDDEDLAWPMGDEVPEDELLKEVDKVKVLEAINAAFDPPEAMTAAFVVTWKGKFLDERHASNVTEDTPLESWSMGKSLTATMMGILVQRGVYTLQQPAPVPEWQGAGDPRQNITIANLLNMSSGLRIRAPQDPDYDSLAGYPDHVYFYTGGVNAFTYAATRPQQWPPDSVGRYRNCDPVLVNYLIRLSLEKSGEDYHSFPQRALFDKLGIRTMVMETDPYGNFMTQGYDYASARDWARLGNLYLQGGKWNGEQIVPEDFVKFVSTVAPAWKKDGRPIYGGFFWINGNDTFPIPADAYYMAGAGGQYTFIIPSHDLVVVRMGHFKGSAKGTESLKAALALLMEAVPHH